MAYIVEASRMEYNKKHHGCNRNSGDDETNTLYRDGGTGCQGGKQEMLRAVEHDLSGQSSGANAGLHGWSSLKSIAVPILQGAGEENGSVLLCSSFSSSLDGSSGVRTLD